MFVLKILLNFCAVLIVNLVSIEAGNRHVDLVHCAERVKCSTHIEDALVDVILDHLHNETDACENFWDYACGEWSAAPFYDHVDNFGAVNNYYVQQLQELLQELKVDKEIPSLIQQLRLYYSTCKKTETYFLDLSKYFEQLANISNIQWQGNHSFDWLAAIAELRRFGLNGVLVDESVGMAFNDSTKYVIELKMPDEGGNFENKQEILRYFEEFGWLLNGKTKETQLQMATKIFDLDLQLRDLRAKHLLSVEDTDASTNLVGLQRLVPNINWWHYLRILFNQQNVNFPELPIEVENIGYLRDISALLEGTDREIISQYILMRFAKFVSNISPTITAKDCINHLGVVFPLGIDFVYDRFFYSKQRRKDEQALQQIFAALKNQFSKYLQANKLNLTKFEQQFVQQKLYKMQLKVGNLPLSMPLKWYDHYYDAAKLSDNNFFRNHLEMLRFRTHLQHLPFHHPTTTHIDPSSYYVNDDIKQVRNAPYFVHQRNMLIVPMTFLHLPFFHHDAHKVFQFSLMGWIMAHEMNHAFELEGILFDADGNESEMGARISRKPAFVAGMNCLATPPTDALIERVADVNGFQLAYDAFLSQGFSATNELQDHGLATEKFTLQELYFLNFAQFFCGNLPQAVDHDRDDVRVIEILHHMPEFEDTFHCNKCSSWNPAKKCEMWRSSIR